MAKYITFDSQQTQNPNPINIISQKFIFFERFKKKLFKNLILMEIKANNDNPDL